MSFSANLKPKSRSLITERFVCFGVPLGKQTSLWISSDASFESLSPFKMLSIDVPFVGASSKTLLKPGGWEFILKEDDTFRSAFVKLAASSVKLQCVNYRKRSKKQKFACLRNFRQYSKPIFLLFPENLNVHSIITCEWPQTADWEFSNLCCFIFPNPKVVVIFFSPIVRHSLHSSSRFVNIRVWIFESCTFPLH